MRLLNELNVVVMGSNFGMLEMNEKRTPNDSQYYRNRSLFWVMISFHPWRVTEMCIIILEVRLSLESEARAVALCLRDY